MANLVAISVRATDDTGDAFTKVKLAAAAAGAQAADAFNDAFKLKADAKATTKDELKSSGSIGGDDSGLLSRLKSYANTPGGIGILGTGSDTSLVSMLKNQIRSASENGGLSLLGGVNAPGNQAGSALTQSMQGSGPGNVTTEDFIKQVMEGNGPSDVTTDDYIKQILEGTKPGNITTDDIIKQVVEGTKPGNFSTTDMIKEVIDPADVKSVGTEAGQDYGTSFTEKAQDTVKSGGDDVFKDIENDAGSSGSSSGKSFASKFLSALSGNGKSSLSGGISSLLTGSSGESEGGDGALEAAKGALNSGGIAGGALPGVAGISGFAATVTGLGAALVAVLPAITSVVGGLGAIGGGFAILEETDTNFASKMSSTMSGIEGVFEKAAQPLAAPLEKAASSIEGYFKDLEPEFQAIFGDSGKLVAPLVSAIEGLVSGVLPGFLALIKAGGPVFDAFSKSASGLGKDLGSMLSDFASASGGSATILSSIMSLVGSLLPFIGDLAKILVSSVAPAFAAFSGALTDVLPALTPLMSVLGSFAGSVLSDFAGILTPIGTLLKDLAPSFTALAKAAGSVFTAMENDGVFASLGSALEKLASPLAGLVNALVKALAPAIPGIVSAFSTLSGILTGAVVSAVGAIATALTKIVSAVPIPVITGIVDAFVAFKTVMLGFSIISAIPGLLSAVGAAFTALAAGMDIDTIALKAMYAWDVIVDGAQAVMDALMAINPFVAIAIAVIAIAALIIKYHTQIWDFIQKIWNDVASFVTKIWGDIESDAESVWNDVATFLSGCWNSIYGTVKDVWNDIMSFIKNWGQDFLVLFGPIGFLAAVVLNIIKYHDQIWNFIQGIWHDILSFLDGIGQDIESALSDTWTSVYNRAVSAWNTIYSWFRDIFSDIVGVFRDASTVLVDAGRDILDGFKNGASAVWGALSSWFRDVYSDVVGYFSHSATALYDYGSDILNSFIAGAKSVYTTLSHWFSDLWNDVIGWAKDILGVKSPSTVFYDIGKNLMVGLANGVEDHLGLAAGKIKAAAQSASTAGATLSGVVANGSAQAALKSAAAEVGWTGAQWAALNDVEMREAGYNIHATNPSSGAYGMAQFINGASEYAEYGGNATTAAGQSVAMVNYIRQRYGTPEAAWAHELSAGWYDSGGWLKPGWNMAYNGTGGLEPVGRQMGAGGSGNVTLEIGSTGNATFDELMIKWVRETVRVKGGGKVQTAFGKAGVAA